MKRLIFIWMLFLSTSILANVYKNKALGIKISYPKDFKINDKSSREKPISIIFEYGTSPASSTIHLKQHRHKFSLKECLVKEKKEQKDGGYLNEMTEKNMI